MKIFSLFLFSAFFSFSFVFGSLGQGVAGDNGDTASTALSAGKGISITGTGTAEDPYVTKVTDDIIFEENLTDESIKEIKIKSSDEKKTVRLFSNDIYLSNILNGAEKSKLFINVTDDYNNAKIRFYKDTKEKTNIILSESSITALKNGVSSEILTKNDISNFDTWHDLVLENGWKVYSSAYASPQYRKFPDGSVVVRGMIKSGKNSSYIATLPVGYRPKKRSIFAIYVSFRVGAIDILPDGRIYSRATKTGWTSIEFRFYTN